MEIHQIERLGQVDKLERTPYTSCPMCARSDTSETLRTDPVHLHPLWSPQLPSTIEWMRCGYCGHVYTSGYFTGEALDVLFSKANKHQLPGENHHSSRVDAARVVANCVGLFDAPPSRVRSWFDVGFGDGSLLAAADEYGFEASGCDVRKSAVDLMSGLGYSVSVEDYTEAPQGSGFNVISMADVIEHFPFPDEALVNANLGLVQGGILYISTPNMGTMSWRVMDSMESNPYWNEIEHYHIFDRGRLYHELVAAGFDVLRYDVGRKYVSGMELYARKR